MLHDRYFIRLVNLSKSYKEGEKQRHVLQDIDISFEYGEFTAILGKSGSGKTTLLNLISGIDLPDSGDIHIGDIHLSALDDHGSTLFRRRHIGFVFQFFNLISTLTVWENVILPLELNGSNNQDGFLRARGLLEEVGLSDRLETFPDLLSGGEQQRVAIVRALVHNPRLVLADEPTGNLDSETGHTIMELLDRLTRQTGKNMILVTHSSEAASYADRIFHLKGGRLIPDGRARL